MGNIGSVTTGWGINQRPAHSDGGDASALTEPARHKSPKHPVPNPEGFTRSGRGQGGVVEADAQSQ